MRRWLTTMAVLAVLFFGAQALSFNHQSLVVRQAPASAACNGAVKGLHWYFTWTYRWTAKRSGPTKMVFPQHKPCPKYMANVWRVKAKKARQDYIRWVRSRTLRDPRDWEKAVSYVQRFFPGTESWLWSCSGAEGSHGAWVPYHDYGDRYYTGYEYSDEVGGWMQYRWSTFKGHFRNGIDELRSRGYILPKHLRDPGNVQAWLSPLGQAIAAGWARWAGEDNSHWQASWGRGC